MAGIFLVAEDGRPGRKTDILAIYGRLSRKCGNLDVSNQWASTACYRDSFTFLYVDDVRTSQETRMDLHFLLQR
jgi:hypothetical protein